MHRRARGMLYVISIGFSTTAPRGTCSTTTSSRKAVFSATNALPIEARRTAPGALCDLLPRPSLCARAGRVHRADAERRRARNFVRAIGATLVKRHSSSCVVGKPSSAKRCEGGFAQLLQPRLAAARLPGEFAPATGRSVPLRPSYSADRLLLVHDAQPGVAALLPVRSASSLPPDFTIRPSDSTCTKSGTM